MKKIICLFLFLVSFQAVSFAFGIDSTMTTVMDSWKGYHIDKVIDRWGYPAEEKTIAGHKIYIWRTERTSTDGEYSTTKPHTDKKGRTYYTTTTYGGETTLLTTERILEVDDNNIVIKGKYSGNDLPFTFMGIAKEWLNPEYDLKK